MLFIESSTEVFLIIGLVVGATLASVILAVCGRNDDD